MTDWRELLHDPAAWAAATSTLDGAQAAHDWLTDTMARIDQQMTDQRPVGRLSDDEWAQHLDWKGSALAFKRRCAASKRDMVRQIKQLNREASEIESREYHARLLATQALARGDLRARLVEALAWMGADRDRAVDCAMAAITEETPCP